MADDLGSTIHLPAVYQAIAAVMEDVGRWLDALEADVRAKHGFGWGDKFPRARRDPFQTDMFQPMCSDCVKVAA